MPTLTDFIQVQTEAGAPYTQGALTVTPEAQVVLVRWPGGGWVWNRPTAVYVAQGTEAPARVPVVDVTGLVIALCTASAVVGWVLVAILRRASNE